MRHIWAAFLVWFTSADVIAQAENPVVASARLETRRSCTLEKSWNDKGSGADLDGFFYLPVVEPSFFMIGGYGTRQKKLSAEDCVLTVGDSAPLVEPFAWDLIWLDRGTGARKDGSMWHGIPPDDGYRCIGTIPQLDYEKPELSNYRCVPAAFTEKVVTSAVIWTDEGSGAKKPVSIFKLPNSGSFVAVPGRMGQIETYDLKLTPVTAATAEVAQAADKKTQLLPAAGLLPAPPASVTAETALPTDEADFAGQALALRQRVVEGADAAVRALRLIPGGGWLAQTVQEDSRDSLIKQIWGPFFRNVIVEVHAVATPTPSALYYNPLLDVALLTHWERHTKLAYRLSGLRVMPGERLSATDATVPVAPDWMAGTASTETLHDTAVARLGAFRRDGVAEHIGAAEQRYEQAVKDLRAAQPRLEWNLSQRAAWRSESNRWLSETIRVIGETLALGDATALIDRATGTDAETASALASLPAEMVERLTLDMAFRQGEDAVLLIISLPDDGDFYIAVKCPLDADAGLCPPEQYILVSFENDRESRRTVGTALGEQWIAPRTEAYLQEKARAEDIRLSG